VRVFHLIILTLIATGNNNLFAQPNKIVTINFNLLFANAPLHLNRVNIAHGKDTVIIETLKFYVSSIELIDNNKRVWKEDNSYHLLDASDASSLKISFNTPPGLYFNRVKFNLGIDSATNVSGAMGGALDPTRGMYWTWQSGYINLKLEGKSNRCKTRNNEFVYHLGGYQGENNALQTVMLNIQPKENIDISMDVATFISLADASVVNHIMSPSKEAVLLAAKFSQLITPGKQ